MGQAKAELARRAERNGKYIVFFFFPYKCMRMLARRSLTNTRGGAFNVVVCTISETEVHVVMPVTCT